MKLGQSKSGSTLFFEGGFSAYKREALSSFDPYSTGSDDCGTIITLAEKELKALFIPEACFYTAFPETWKGKLSMKLRRANQLVRVFWRYLLLLTEGRIRTSKEVIIQGILNYLFGPLMFVALVITTALLLLTFPYFALFLLVIFVPRIGILLFEAIQNYIILLLSIFSVIANARFSTWSQPEDRSLLNRKLLQQHNLI
jgi:cellulose synthase/poly-beta-1,6-N-acetylglucosamine synthase-like glycosyltransferase